MLILWAIDAVREPGSLMEQSAAVLDEWAERLSLRIEPVYVFSPAQLDLGLDVEKPPSEDWAAPYRASSEKMIGDLVQTYSSSHPHLRAALLPPKIIHQPRSSVRAAVEALENYAVSRQAEWIMLATHGRRGVWRLLMGSFAETLLLRAQTPTLTIGPQMLETPSLKRILFATDFGEGSKALFREVVSFAKKSQSNLLLYHSVPNLLEPIFQSGAYLFSGSWIPARNYFSEEVQERHRRGSAWARWATHQGVECQFILDETSGNITEHILSLIGREKVDLLALASRSGAVTSTLLGSITRQLVRAAPCPVWVLNPLPPGEASQNPRALAG